MNEQDQPGPADEPGFDDPGFDDPGFDEVRALLAEARVTAPVPDDVAARLDATLASLQAERAGAPEPGAGHPAVVPLRQRLRRGAGRALVAAAVLAVVGGGGVGIAQLARNSSGGSADSTASADRAEDSGGGSGATGTAPEAPGPVKDAPQALSGARPVPALTAAAFAADAARVMVDLAGEQTDQPASKAATPGPTGATGDLDTRSPAAGYVAAEAPPVTASPRDTTDSLNALDSCAGPAAPDAVTVPATLDGGRVALVFRPPTVSGQRVEAWSCDGGTLLQAATVPITPPS